MTRLPAPLNRTLASFVGWVLMAALRTCRPRAVRPTDIDPPEVRRDRNCPLHGIDPDRTRDERRDA